jgi:hypothetical protein
MKDICSKAVIGHTFIPGMNGQCDIVPSIPIVAELNIPNVPTERNATTPRLRIARPILGVKETSALKYI